MIRQDFNNKLVKQSKEFADSHEMLTEALQGQVYLKARFNKVNTNQVTGEALKKVSVGGKGGFGSQGDARDQEKQVQATARVMVMCGPTQEIFDYNALLEKKVVGWDEAGKPIYIKQGESHSTEHFVPSHIFGEREIKGLTKFTTSHGRDYDEFVHSNQLDPADCQAYNEFFQIDLDRTRALYDELCGYKDAWKYCRDDMEWVDGRWEMKAGVKARRYLFEIHNLINLKKEKKDKRHNPETGYMTWEASSYNHHVVGPNYALYLESNPNARKDCVQFVLHQLRDIPNDTEAFLSNLDRSSQVVYAPSEEALRIKDAMDSLHRKKRLAALEKGPDLSDWRVVYNWELTKQGKVMFNEKI